MQFVVPQFIDVESKILGPLTARQFVLLVLWAFFLFLTFKIFSFLNFIILAILESLVTFLFAFIKINGRLFHHFIISILQTQRIPKTRIWHKEDAEYEFRFELAAAHKAIAPMAYKQPLSQSRLTEISLVVDTGGAYNEEGEVIAHKEII
jgi:hypothetical protein